MTLHDSYWTTPDTVVRLMAPPGWTERLLRALSRRAMSQAIRLKQRRIENAERQLIVGSVDVPVYLRRDIGLPPFTQAQDVSQYR
jgi:hypothetical protein